MSKSLLSNEPECFFCKTTMNLHRHHIFAGARRQLSERYGCWVYLCAAHHNMSNKAVHNNKDMDLFLKKKCQEAWEKNNGRREDFVSVFGKSYL